MFQDHIKILEPDISRAWAEVDRLATPGVIGLHTHFEVTEIFAVLEPKGPAHNVFSILAAEDRSEAFDEPSRYLGSQINLKSFKGAMFGIKRSYIAISRLEEALDRFKATGEWRLGDQRLLTGDLVPVEPLFVPADSTETVPLNNLLKNNFWNGSHVIELMDVSKETLRPLLEVPSRLQELSAAIQKEAPIRIASLSDRLGNILIQMPVTILMAAFAKNRMTGETSVTIRWHPKTLPRLVRASVEMRFDKVVTAHASADVTQLQQTLPTVAGDGLQHTALWDDHHNVLLARSSATGFIETVAIGMNLLGGEPRIFTVRNQRGEEKEVRVSIIRTSQNEVGAPAPERGRTWIQRRIYREETSKLIAERRFIPYKPLPGQQEQTHQKALGDIRALISQHGRGGVWLWDPYLSADDVIQTLFHCPFAGVDLRALTAGYEPPDGMRTQPTFVSVWRQLLWVIRQRWGNKPPAEPSFAERQRTVFVSAKSNLQGLRIEYRMKSGSDGWAFHDRFLIFPDAGNGGRAWSLGTSVNALGRQHHILQEVDDSRHVIDAFLELWDQLGAPEHLIWKVP